MDRYLRKKYKGFTKVPFEYLYAELLIESNSPAALVIRKYASKEFDYRYAVPFGQTAPINCHR